MGDIYVRSMVGQPLVAEIPIKVDPVEAASLEGSAGLDEACEDGVGCPLRIVAALSRSTGSAGVLRIYSDLPVRAPGFKLRAWLRWETAQGNSAEVVRTYAVRFVESEGEERAARSAVAGPPGVEQPLRKAEPPPVMTSLVSRMAADGAPAAAQAASFLPQEIATFVGRWAAAWSAKDMGAYLGFYADDYAPSGMDRSEWVSERTRRIAGREESIHVRCDALSVKLLGATGAVVTFHQSYQTPTWRSSGRKTMRLARKGIGETWKIVEERMDGEGSAPGRRSARRR